jgi:hypothetical protein
MKNTTASWFERHGAERPVEVDKMPRLHSRATDGLGRDLATAQRRARSMTDDTRATKGGFSKPDFYRLCREWHGYLSAAAFLALVFFSVTGILLNHPGLLQGEQPAPVETMFTLTAEEVAAIQAAPAPAAALAELARARTDLAGAFRDGEVVGEDVYANLQGARGRSNVTGNLRTGEVRIYIEREDAIGVLNALHRGEHAGRVWRLLIDLTAALFIVMSVIGFILFLSLRFRLRTALVLTTASLIVMIGVFMFATA